ncbi:hypothetical protein [Actinacidiphila soli]|uniref:hypothetical protein n=1 Tax=Actinacidiphila soli TaxID=2487275 RepID=UPI000FCBBC2A|nr:hypothetical protein [Actinacidiphila soli]
MNDIIRSAEGTLTWTSFRYHTSLASTGWLRQPRSQAAGDVRRRPASAARSGAMRVTMEVHLTALSGRRQTA